MNLRKFLSNVAIVMAISTLFISYSTTVLAASKSKTEKASLVIAATSTSGDTKEVSGENLAKVVPEEEKLISEKTTSGDTAKKEEAVASEDQKTVKVASGDVTKESEDAKVSGEVVAEPETAKASGEAVVKPEKVEGSGEVAKSGDIETVKTSGDAKISGDKETIPSEDIALPSGETIKTSGDNKLVKDINDDDWYFEYVLDAIDGKLMAVDSGDNFNPDNGTTKEDVAKALFSLNEQKVAKEAKTTKSTKSSSKTTKTSKTSSKSKKE